MLRIVYIERAVEQRADLELPFDMARRITSEKSKPSLVAVRWDRPGSIYHGQVHRVSEVLVDYLGCGRVVVWWPSRTRGKQWSGELVNRDGK